MKLPRRSFLHLTAGAAAVPAMSHIAGAQTYPSRSITMVVPFAAGGPVDTLARIVAERMRTSLGQPVVIENVTGAGGSIGAGRVARAVPDGYTLIIGIWTTHVVNGAIYALQYDVLNDFEPIALLANNPQVIVAKKSMPANDLKGLIAWLKANPDKASAGTAGVGSPQHVLGIFFQSATGTRFQFVHYRGGGPATQDLVAGQIDIIVADQVTALPQILSGNIKAYAVTNKNRLAAAPDIPTVDEAGLPEFYTTVWNAIWAPKGTPKNIIGKLNVAVVDGLSDSAVRRRLADLGQQIVPRDHQTPEALAAFHKAEIEKWWPIIKAAGIKAGIVAASHHISGRNAMKLPRRQFLHLAAGAAALPAVSRIAWAQAYPARPVRIDRRLCRRRRGRHRRAPDRAMAVGAAWPAIRHREPAGRRRQYRHRGGRACAAGRLHAAAGRLRRTRSMRRSTTSSISISSATSRRSRASSACRIVMEVTSVGSGQDGSRVHRLCQGQSGQDQHGIGRQRDLATCVRRAVQDDDRRRHGARAVSRRGARAHRSARRAGAGDVRPPCRRRSSTSGPASCARWR